MTQELFNKLNEAAIKADKLMEIKTGKRNLIIDELNEMYKQGCSVDDITGFLSEVAYTYYKTVPTAVEMMNGVNGQKPMKGPMDPLSTGVRAMKIIGQDYADQVKGRKAQQNNSSQDNKNLLSKLYTNSIKDNVLDLGKEVGREARALVNTSPQKAVQSLEKGVNKVKDIYAPDIQRYKKDFPDIARTAHEQIRTEKIKNNIDPVFDTYQKSDQLKAAVGNITQPAVNRSLENQGIETDHTVINNIEHDPIKNDIIKRKIINDREYEKSHPRENPTYIDTNKVLNGEPDFTYQKVKLN